MHSLHKGRIIGTPESLNRHLQHGSYRPIRVALLFSISNKDRCVRFCLFD
ncbi:hypothetical protein HanRHA438_Chr05g0232911 [Helianthus annuus]|nr:hypothetical protein HanRHA438_Chr05g0232911 [Helianthus annuus]